MKTTLTATLLFGLLTNTVFAAETLKLSAIKDFAINSIEGNSYYVHEGRNALAINAGKKSMRNKFYSASYTVKQGEFNQIKLTTLTELDGESQYKVAVNDKVVAILTNPETNVDYKPNTFVLDKVTVKAGDVVHVYSNAVTNGKIPENDETAYARGRWVNLTLIKTAS
ncbi:hypothetical protein C2869_15340 [Saccharobesus litoralis]|uniref:Uncharacterized protein n=1 Tax=Saccharobesus litoralis TaxID=2172099 RepID=A0A2S0VU33_9ALTE|nr:hypothetical protein [Saccharobesus litoralis]AWB67727.1 hypothetical protein C2869_15340 [Saccharobesus litoralis]